MCVCVYMYVSVCEYVDIYMCSCVCVCLYVSMCLYIRPPKSILRLSLPIDPKNPIRQVQVCVCVCVCEYVCVCV